MNDTLHALALIYRKSAAAQGGVVKDYILDWEKFLRQTGRDDGDARELAEQELLAAERASGGLFVIGRHARTQAKEVLRLKRDGGEAWLFAATGLPSPAEERSNLARFFGQLKGKAIPATHASDWSAWCDAMAASALRGDPVSPFKRDDPSGNASLSYALAGVLNWQGESLIRYASAVICRDSKALENLLANLLIALRGITGREDVSLEDFGIFDKPRSVLVHGPLVLELKDGRVDFGLLSGPVAISAIDLAGARLVECKALRCVTVENESVFLELAKRKTEVLLVHTSFVGAATRLLFERLRPDLGCHHFGDSDPAGFDVLRDLREKTGRDFQPLMMQFRARADAPSLTGDERKVIARLLGSDLVSDVNGELQAMLAAGTKGAFEQEEVPLDDVVREIARI
ncbi:MAG TPA: Wadjet anti-phage system protein JetD domain-containing protein [Haloferula sp.]